MPEQKGPNTPAAAVFAAARRVCESWFDEPNATMNTDVAMVALRDALADAELAAIRRLSRTWYCEATGKIWTGEPSNHHGIVPGMGYCGGPHRPLRPHSMVDGSMVYEEMPAEVLTLPSGTQRRR